MPKEYLALADEDRARLAEVGALLEPRIEALVAGVLALHAEAAELAGFFTPEERESRVRTDLARYVATLREGTFEAFLDWAEERVRQRRATGVSYAALATAILGRQDAVAAVLRDALPDDAARTPYRQSLQRFGHQQMVRVGEAHARHQEETIREQQSAMLALSTPVIEVWDGVLVAPLVGAIDDARARQITRSLLRAIRDTQAGAVILDITGVPDVDTGTANHLMKALRAARLLGARGLVAGISPEIADTLVALDVDLGDAATHFSLQQALRAAVAPGRAPAASALGR